MRKGYAFPVGHSTNSREAVPQAGGIASNKSDALTERQSLSALESGKAATGTIGKTAGKLPPSLRDIADFEREEMMAAFREVFSANAELDRDATIREVARALGFNRTGSRITDHIGSIIPIATRRGIIYKTGNGWMMDCRSISAYSRDNLIDALLNAMGRTWWQREDAIRAAARYLGFRRTGRQIRDAFKSVINGGIRRGVLEYEGAFIRRVK